MHLQKLNIHGYKCFSDRFEIEFRPGLNVLVGENASGKSAIIDAIRQLLLEYEFGRSGISDSDFHKPFQKDGVPSSQIRIETEFADLTDTESVAFLPWIIADNRASLHLEVDDEKNSRYHYKKTVWGGASKSSIFEWELFYKINCIYLPPLRDAEARLKEGKSSRLARLIKNLQKNELESAKNAGTKHQLEEKFIEFQKSISKDKDLGIAQTNQKIKEMLREAIGDTFGQDTLIQFSETSFNRIVESLRLLFFPGIGQVKQDELERFRALNENSLGYNNLLYIATVLAELTSDVTNDDFLKILLIEEPEAHLHPQMQIRLLKYLEKVAITKGLQVIVTTHSPVLASAVTLDSLIHLTADAYRKIIPTPLSQCGLSEPSKAFVCRWLDATKSVLLFAKGVILVEGISEAMLMPEFAKRVLSEFNEKPPQNEKLPKSLEDAGVAVINMNGIYFKHFMQLFCNLRSGDNKNIPVKCSGITDCDPDGADKPTHLSKCECKNKAIELESIINESTQCRLWHNLKTFEYDMALEGNNLKIMANAALDDLQTDGIIRKTYEEYCNKDWETRGELEKADAAFYLLEHIEKGEFAQALAQKISDPSVPFTVPQYIKDAILWACGRPLESPSAGAEKTDG